ncbi:DUF1501 domain-containing protein [Paraglaciecola aquimarina]|uniref:DUF1501 domain-containing protein n=1 Tax=Paraglaciecola algarum TaxID=3050085 RepID=A0ABS9D4M8_9ALTE|nr:DUF1501 domain-containing protein [Paraglaciecola sp. G1-23]MCF2947870.1 DUF1501 domain-containing protein [Paraglaciecola sp. G1-23]
MNLFKNQYASQAEIEALEIETLKAKTRREFIKQSGAMLGGAFLSSMLAPNVAASGSNPFDYTRPLGRPLAPLAPPYPGKAKRVIYMHMAGAPSQLEMFDYKPELKKYDGQLCPEEFLKGKRFAFISGVPKLLGPQFPFKQEGESGAWISDRLPHLAKHVDDMCFIKSMHTDQFNHAPAQILALTGNARPGHPSLGAWTTYGLGTANQNLPGFVSLISGSRSPDGGKPLWGSGYLPSAYQGVKCRSQGDPVLYLSNPKGVNRPLRRHVLDALAKLNQQNYQEMGNPETLTRIAQYEMAYRMQVEASDAFDIGLESETTLANYGAEVGKKSFANNALVARRLAESGVRFIQLFDWDWDGHGTNDTENVSHGLAKKCSHIDKPIAALLSDLKDRGMLDDTLVIWGGEFGRTPMQENRGGQDNILPGRDHHPNAYTMWLAGGGVKGGYTHGETDEMGYDIVKDPVSIHDLHATILYLLGFNHQNFTYPYQGLNQRLTGVHDAHIVSQLLA